MGYRGYDDDSGDDASGLAALLGDYDVSGDYDVAGLSLRNVLMPHTLLTDRLNRRGGRSAAPAALARVAAQRSALVNERSPSKSRRLVLPVDSGSTLIVAAATATVAITPTNVFKPDRFMVDPAIAPSFIINDIKIGRASQLIGSGSVPATVFSPNLADNGIGFDTVQTSQPISVSVTNTAAAASLRFMGAFIGWEVE